MSNSGSSEATTVPSDTASPPTFPESTPPRQWRARAARIIELALVGALCVVVVTQQVQWSYVYHEAPAADAALHIVNATAFGAVMDSPAPLADKALCAWAWPDLYGSAVYITSYLLRPLTGNSATGLLNSLSVYLCIAVVAAWLLGRASGGPAAGVTAATLLISDPRFVHASRRYWLDLPVTAMILLTLATLVYSEGFRKRGRGVMAGVLLGLALLVKYTAIWFLAVPFVAAFAWGVWRERPSRVALARFSVAAALAGLAFVWLTWLSLQHPLFVRESGTLTPPFSYQLVFGCAAVALAWATFAWYLLDGVLATGTWAAACTLFIAGPWVVVNRSVLGSRWNAIMLESPDTLAHWRENVHALLQPLPFWVQIGAAASVLVALASPRKRAALMPIVLALIGGTVATLVVLGSADRYLTPVTALLSVLAVGWVPNLRWVAGIVCGACLLVTLPVAFGGPIGYSEVSDFVEKHYPYASVAYTHLDTPDREDLANAASSAAKGEGTIAILSLPTNRQLRDDIDSIYYLLAAAENRSGAPRLVEIFATQQGSLEVRELLAFEATRVRSLAAWRGASAPLDWRSSGVAPTFVLFERSVADPVAVARQLFGRTYAPVPADLSDLVMLRLVSATAPR